MALGTVTPQTIDPHLTTGQAVSVGDLKMTVTNVVGEASYTGSGGVTITAQQLGFPNAIVAAQAEVIASTGSNATSTAMAVVVQSGGGSAKLQCFTNANAEISGSTNVSGVTWQIIAFGY